MSHSLPSPLKKLLRPLYFGWLDTIDWGQRLKNGQLHLPPRRLRDVGDSDFEATGREFVTHFQQTCQLKPHETVLEIGCGSGRIAMPLTAYLTPPGLFYGIDIVKPAIEWCQQNITAKHAHFQFFHADLYNKRYNPQATQLANEYTFPFEDEQFDFIYLTSVFTHLLPDDLNHYLSEVYRLLKPTGRVLATFFVLNQAYQPNKAAIDFQFARGVYYLRDETIPESAVGYQEDYLLQTLRQHGFIMPQPILYGQWRGQQTGLSFQDFIILMK